MKRCSESRAWRENVAMEADRSNERTRECTDGTDARGVGGGVAGSRQSGARFSLLASLSTSSLLPDILTRLALGVGSGVISMALHDDDGGDEESVCRLPRTELRVFLGVFMVKAEPGL